MTEDYLERLMPHVLADLERREQAAGYFDDVAAWAEDFLGLKLWWKQEEIAQAIATGPIKSVAVRAGHGVGKSFLAALLVCWWIDTRPIQYVFVASTAPSADQVGAILWREIRRFHSLSQKRFAEHKKLKAQGKDASHLPDHQLPGYITMDNKWRDNLGNLIGQGRKPPDHSEDAFQGIHAEYVLAIGDEACGLTESMIDSLSNITSNAKSRRLLIANPTNPRSRLGTIFRDDTGAWSLHHISVLHSPNFHGGGICDCPEHVDEPLGLGLSEQALASLTDQSYVDEKKLEYGENSARYKARVLGEFAYEEGNTLFTQFEIGKATDATVEPDVESYVILGVDVARMGRDSTFIYKFEWGLIWMTDPETNEKVALTDSRGGHLRFVDSWQAPGVDRLEKDGTITVGTASLIHSRAMELNAREVRIDASGMGMIIIDALTTLAGNQYEIIEMMGGGPTPDRRTYFNNRAFQFSQMRDRFGRGEIDIDPEDRLLVEELEDILYEITDGSQGGGIKIESKESMKRRGVKSPDAADAAWYACADLTHLDGPQPGDTLRRTPEEILGALELSGFRDAYPM